LSGDIRYAGTQIPCPACQKPVPVPSAPAPAPVAVAAPPGAGLAPQRSTLPPAPRPPLAATGRTSGLAIASLICSAASFILLPLGFIPGIICGHLARKQIARDPALGGGGLAKAGLIVGYAALGIQGVALVAALTVVLLLHSSAKPRFQAQSANPPPQVRSQRLGPRTEVGRSVTAEAEGPVDTTPDADGWTLQLQGASVPAGPVTGRIKGREFSADKVSLDNGWLKFRQGAGVFADLEMNIVLFIPNAAAASDKTYTFPKQGSGINPHIWMKWKAEGQNTPEQKSWVKDYALQLEFGSIADGKLPGKIYLCVPDREKSFIRGTFEVAVKP
jgi:hypothetical protein